MDERVVFPAVEATLLSAYLCHRCVGYGTDTDKPSERCSECGGEGALMPGETLRVTLVGWQLHSCGTWWTHVAARITYPWHGLLGHYDMPKGSATMPAFGERTLEIACLAAAIDALSRASERGPSGASYTSVRLVAPVTWPTGWTRERKRPSGTLTQGLRRYWQLDQ